MGCGTVYLTGWTNVDMPGPKTFLATARPDLAERLATTEDDYYKNHASVTIDTLSDGPLNQEMVCDVFGSLENIPASYWSVSHVLLRQVFEHLSLTEAHRALDQIDGVMEPNGVLTIDVPDHEQTLELYRRTGNSFYSRHLLGPRNSEHGYHLSGYSRERLKSLVEEHGFVFESEERNIHLYPAFCLRFVKPGPRAPRDYVTLPPIPSHWRVLDIGPGGYPLPRADFYLDCTMDNLKPLQEQGKGTILDNLAAGLPKVEDKSFDYVFCSHVLEHQRDPADCVATLNRISKRGTIVVPSALKEGLFLHEESEHLWSVLPNPICGGAPIFVRKNRCDVDKVADREMQSIMCRLFRTGPSRIPEQRYLRKWFYQHEADLDVIVHWDERNPLKVQVIG
jgi:predicted SAM-dependent methyltransferase